MRNRALCLRWGASPSPGRSFADWPRAIAFASPPPSISVTCWALPSRICKEPSESTSAAGDTVYDIGANLGYVSLSLAKQVGPSGHVVAFEPVPRNIELLRRNIELNGLRNIRLLELAASDKSGEAVIRLAENLATASMVWHRNNPAATELSIKTVAVDDLVAAGDLAYPAFVKIDVEGAEGSVLLGMRAHSGGFKTGAVRRVFRCKPRNCLESASGAGIPVSIGDHTPVDQIRSRNTVTPTSSGCQIAWRSLQLERESAAQLSRVGLFRGQQLRRQRQQLVHVLLPGKIQRPRQSALRKLF